MRIALLSDIHGNLTSLEAVLADMDQFAVDQVVCLGDVATLGPQPKEVVERIKDLGWIGIRGNHEDYIFDVNLIERDKNTPPWFEDSILWSTSQLSQSDLDYLGGYVPRHEVQLDEKNSMLCFHGSPRSNNELILAETPAGELAGLLDGYNSQVMACGHTHVQMMRRLNEVVVINAGSVGEPMERMPFSGEPRILPWAEYALVTWERGGLSVNLRQVPIDVARLKQACTASGNPFDWFGNWVDGRRL